MVITYFFSRVLGHYVYYLYFIGFAVMMYLAISILKSTFSPRNTSSNRSPFLNYFMGVSMGLTNPYQVFLVAYSRSFLHERLWHFQCGWFVHGDTYLGFRVSIRCLCW
ncbi:hypothetical protein [Vulcanisaeta sp. JCM 16159]|uniref:hypothetical protein n=1 Tax=Vulcanisaeta sp. JCM 16159 TaxID=1295371 RepID=UPI003465BFFF